jgi:xanthine dehydrogenase/oxidase
MSLFGVLKLNPSPSLVDIEEAFDGNLCRCTGYRSILETSRSFVHQDKCTNQNKKEKVHGSCQTVDFNEFRPYDPQSDITFPSYLTNEAYISNQLQHSVYFKDDSNGSIWFRPNNLNELLKAKFNWPNAKIIGGNTEIGVEMALKSVKHNCFIYIGDMIELKDVQISTDKDDNSSLEIGVNITLNDLMKKLENLKKSDNYKQWHQSVINSFLSNMRWFASNQIRNFATLAGNISTASPISDLNPILLATNAVLTVSSLNNGERNINMREFFLSYRQINLRPDELILSVQIPLPKSNFHIVRAYKQAKRRVDDIAIANGCFSVQLEESKDTESSQLTTPRYRIVSLDIAIGGLDVKTIYLSKVAEESIGLIWSDGNSLDKIENLILESLTLPYSAPGASPIYRRTLVLSFFNRFWYQVVRDCKIKCFKSSEESTSESCIENGKKCFNLDEIEREISTSSQDFKTNRNGTATVGGTRPHVAGLLHSTGKATYTDDNPKQHNELCAALVLSKKANAKIISIDTEKALSTPGVHAYISHKDLYKNNFGIIIEDDEYFAVDHVHFVGQIIGVVVAETRSLAKSAASMVDVQYEVINNGIINASQALEADSFHPCDTIEMIKGKWPEQTDDSKDILIEGTVKVGGQDHFYLETPSCLAIPKTESNEIEVIMTTQYISGVQLAIAKALNIPENKILVRCKRIGGAFGGKETRSVIYSVPIAAAARKLKRPVRLVLDRSVDMLISGGRNPYDAKYKVLVSPDGYFKAFDIDCVASAGFTAEATPATMMHALHHIDGVYNFPHLNARGRTARTNVSSNTA